MIRGASRGLLALCLVTAACSGPRQPTGEPLRAYPVDVEIALDLTSPLARPFLVDGWRLPNGDAERASAQGMAPRSVLAFVGFAQRDRRLTLRGRPVSGDLQIELALDGRVVDRQLLVARGGTLNLDIPASAWADGVNLLELRYLSSDRHSAPNATRSPTGPSPSAPTQRVPMVDWASLSLSLLPSTDPGPNGHPVRSLVAPAGAGELHLLPSDGGSIVGRLLGSPAALRLRQDGVEPADHTLKTDRPVAIDGEQPALLEVFGERLLPFGPPAAQANSATSESPCRHARANVVVYLVDTLRRDRLGVYGDRRGLSRRLDALAERSWVWQRAVAQSSWTRPTVASVMTGLSPLAHGVNGRHDTLADQYDTVAEAFEQAGWQTAGIVTNPNVSGRHGFRQGFGAYRLLSEPSADNVNRRALAWLDTRDPEQPFFLYLHSVEPHAPYAPAAEFRQRFAPDVPLDRRFPRAYMNQLAKGERRASPETIAEIEALYDASVAENDAAFGELLDALAERKLLDSTAILFLSDHGEEFFEHGGWEHGKTLHAEQIDIPLVAWLPGCGARVLTEAASQLDVAATLLDYAGVIEASGIDGDFGQGRSLVRSSRSAEHRPGHPRQLFSFLRVDQFHGAALSSWPFRRIEGASPGFRGTGTWSRADDPRETRDLAAERAITTAWLHIELRRRFSVGEATASQVGDEELSEEMVRQLRALGYVE